MSCKVVCRTNLDTFKYVLWPERLASVPEIGSWVRGKPAFIQVKRDGEIKSIEIHEPTLKVVGVTHVAAYGYELNNEPYVVVELHHPDAHALGWLY